MTGFTSISHYSPWLVLLVGGISVAAVIGLGNLIGVLLDLRQPWRTTVGCIAALQVFSLGVQALSIPHLASRAALIALWAAFSIAGFLALVVVVRRSRPRIQFSAATGLFAAVFMVQLLIAICPSTKADDIFYHMVVPSRIVLDGGLTFYRGPFISAIYPQMFFQIGFAPFHALGVPDAGNVVNWSFGPLLAWFTYSIVVKRTGSPRWAAFFSAVLVAGLYMAVWYVSSSAYAVGDVAVTAAVVALYLFDELIAEVSAPKLAAMFSILAAAAASSKVSLMPLSGAIVVIVLLRLRRNPRAAIMTLLPAIVVMAPLLLWTFVESGSPFGPLYAGKFGKSVYNLQQIRTYLDEYASGIRGPIPVKLRNMAVEYSPLIWVAVVAFVAARKLVRVPRAIGIAFLALQFVVIAGWLTYDIRYLGGVHYALMILTACFLVTEVRQRLDTRHALAIGAALFIAPWIVLQVVYAAPFVRFVAGGQSPQAFCEERVPFFRDFIALDHRLDHGAVLLAYPFATNNSHYAPRPILFDPADVPSGRTAYLIIFTAAFEKELEPRNPPGFRLAEMVYENKDALVATYRTPGYPERRGIVQVWRLERDRSTS